MWSCVNRGPTPPQTFPIALFYQLECHQEHAHNFDHCNKNNRYAIEAQLPSFKRIILLTKVPWHEVEETFMSKTRKGSTLSYLIPSNDLTAHIDSSWPFFSQWIEKRAWFRNRNL
jgi:hypothetical protein